MNFDGSKENIQPLKGGRNAQQLEMALQAQTNHEYQLILMQQKEEFELKIQNYDGDDPLDNYYNYITWIEQSYPKNGHEGKCFEILEHCLGKFENDSRYTNDKRFCKLWIKYIDMFPNPVELYLMMKSKSLCIGCAEFYKAWAYYYEVAGDYQKANKVIEEGRANLAQPLEDLENTQRNLIIAAGEHTIFGPNENRLHQRRQALVSLGRHSSSSYYSDGANGGGGGGGRINNLRMPSTAGCSGSIGICLPRTTSTSETNVQHQIYKDHTTISPPSLFGSAPPKSIISVAKRQEAPKENTMKPGPWTTIPHKKRVLANQKLSGFQFTVHEDDPTESSSHSHLPSECLEDYSNWHVMLINCPGESTVNVFHGYPKHRVYCDPNTEFSIEEIRAARYKNTNGQLATNNMSEAILINDEDDNGNNDNDDCVVIYQDEPTQQDHQQQQQQQPVVTEDPKKQFNFNIFRHSPSTSSSSSSSSPLNEMISTVRHSPWKSQAEHQSFLQDVFSKNNEYRISAIPTLASFRNDSLPIEKQTDFKIAPLSGNCNNGSGAFAIYEQSIQEIPPKGNAMKTAFRTLNADEVETGSRGGMEGAMAAQPDADGARAMASLPFSDSSSSSIDNGELMNYNHIDSICSTQQFNFNLNAMQVSTPKIKLQLNNDLKNEPVISLSTKKRLFSDSKIQDKALSTIIEEKSGYTSSSCSSGAVPKTSNTQQMKTISEEHNSYLAQNLKANAALRRSLLGDLVDNLENEPPHLEPMVVSLITTDNTSTPNRSLVFSQSSPLTAMESTPYQSPIKTASSSSSSSMSRIPLNYIPPDPFDPQLIAKLLNLIEFPGIYCRGGLVHISGNPRLVVRKEPVCLGVNKYVIAKVLGKGQFGTVYKAIDLKRNEVVALKYQKPPNKWEFYICRELQVRLRDHPLCSRFMDISIGYFSDQASIIVSQFQPIGSLLDMANFLKEHSLTKELICLYFTLEMIKIVKALHEVKIIHADIKPDNFLVILHTNNTLTLQLVDFGRSIDMTLFPANACFTVPITTENFICCEVVEGRPWSYHTDLFCIAASAHVLLFHEYIQLRKNNNIWSITKSFPRYIKHDLWNMFFNTLLNQQTGPADIATLEFLFQEELEPAQQKRELSSQLRTISNLLKSR